MAVAAGNRIIRLYLAAAIPAIPAHFLLPQPWAAVALYLLWGRRRQQGRDDHDEEAVLLVQVQAAFDVARLEALPQERFASAPRAWD